MTDVLLVSGQPAAPALIAVEIVALSLVLVAAGVLVRAWTRRSVRIRRRDLVLDPGPRPAGSPCPADAPQESVAARTSPVSAMGVPFHGPLVGYAEWIRDNAGELSSTQWRTVAAVLASAAGQAAGIARDLENVPDGPSGLSSASPRPGPRPGDLDLGPVA
ncbi:hypothetical protein CFN78_18290 [Amycolatopsis antarctica]|uniref:Uncharacterized protein n=1 Tax=Amycolatopsis antarctica TaxID=1854586 RepID=A0A263D0N6_9PSEU|nr:hypothetical protein [Amycolatopsis antarctica]OZM71779.1 hypothetical protein CFN78_18290 [Amycolatopsis antarctica]